MKLGRCRTAFGVLMTVLLAGCASVPMAPADADSLAKAFATRPDKSTVYVYRNERYGGAARMTVSLDGRVAGQTGPRAYFVWDVDPGTHEIVSQAENTDTVTITTQDGKDYYISQEAKAGLWGARTRLHIVTDDVGRNAVAECRLAQSSF
jgi:hypothetical protein